ncbi:STAS domain-containing protein [Calothrix sp. FACHB-1219]|uniref:STAS domain-containing protein n=1 Tax=unclassified Calothrix TaxID=2619626 RepID=UPI0016867EBE|nr:MULTISPECIES: STAS domain-containing protein [unclassified Calothrix]MBD2203572.1 STAS domain-containing protein [Calothrix sp. FACHB-168]MBD2221183.1 STAS domain-containing protein [Calothrix sp. FACHB-1219]
MKIIVKTIKVTATKEGENGTTVKVHEEVTLVELEGDVDGKTAPEVQDQVLPLVKPKSKLLLDLTTVPYMSSAGLRALLSLHRKFSDQEGKLVLVGVAPEIQDTMEVTGFLNFFTISKNIKSGLASLEVEADSLPAESTLKD